jgi:predicted lipoprotein with Yx(FWY)xxD motif
MLPEYLGDPFASEKVTVGAVSTALTAATYAAGAGMTRNNAKNAVVTSDITTDFRFTIDGTAPTASNGHFVDVSVDRNPIILRGHTAIAKFRAIGDTAVLYVTYFK